MERSTDKTDKVVCDDMALEGVTIQAPDYDDDDGVCDNDDEDEDDEPPLQCIITNCNTHDEIDIDEGQIGGSISCDKETLPCF
jgi:hypothetical protein